MTLMHRWGFQRSGFGTKKNGYINKVLGIASGNLIAYWPGNETSGTNADNAEGTAARDGTYSGVTLDAITGPAGLPTGQWDGTNDVLDIYSTSLRDAFNDAEGTAMVWAKVSGAGVWTDSTNRYLLNLRTDSNNQVQFLKLTSNNDIFIRYEAGGVQETVTDSSLAGTLDWFHLAITWSVAADEMKAYINGSQVGSTQTVLGTWVGNLSSTETVIGAANTTPGSVWDGYLAHPAIWTTPLTGAQILDLATV